MPRERLGAALLVPPPHDAAVDALRQAVGDGSLGRIPPHLTLVPPVNVREEDVDAALDLLRETAASRGPLTVELGPPTSFLPDNPVLYLAVGGDVEAVRRLRDLVFRPPLERTLSWPYVPHVTLADEGDPARLGAAMEALADFRLEVTFTRVHLLREERDDEGVRVWRPYADARLARPAVVGRGGLELTITEGAGLTPGHRALLDEWWKEHDSSHEVPWHEEPFALTGSRDGEVVGMATGWTNAGVAYLGELVVAPGVRGEGVGGHLLAAFEDLARRRGAFRLALRTDAAGRARALYEARGWQVEATFADWIAGREFVQMRRVL
jgi:2'-5' RNA ligase